MMLEKTGIKTAEKLDPDDFIEAGGDMYHVKRVMPTPEHDVIITGYDMRPEHFRMTVPGSMRFDVYHEG